MKHKQALLAVLVGVVACMNGPSVSAAQDREKPIMAWRDLLGRTRPAPDATMAYGDNRLQVVDVWRPKEPGSHPAVIMIHGGCWQSAVADRTIMNWIADDLRSHGVGVWNIEYRGVDTGGGMPQTYEDVAAAADLLAAKGSAFGFRQDGRQIVIGHSAGGHLALWLGRRDALAKTDSLRGRRPIKIELAISQGGLPDLRAQSTLADHGCGADGAKAMARGEFARTSPPEMPPGDAHELLFNNERDKIAPPSFGAAYLAANASRGARVEMVTTADEGHVELIAPESVSWTRQRDAILRALGISPGLVKPQ